MTPAHLDRYCPICLGRISWMLMKSWMLTMKPLPFANERWADKQQSQSFH